MSKNFKDTFSFEKRLEEASKILDKYPEKIPVIVQKNKRCKNVDDISKNKFLVPADLTLAQFIYVIKKRIQMTAEMSLYVFTKDDAIPSSTATLQNLYEEFKDEDKFLYLFYAGENTFG